jgi:hypothetical protein
MKQDNKRANRRPNEHCMSGQHLILKAKRQQTAEAPVEHHFPINERGNRNSQETVGVRKQCQSRKSPCLGSWMPICMPDHPVHTNESIHIWDSPRQRDTFVKATQILLMLEYGWATDVRKSKHILATYCTSMVYTSKILVLHSLLRGEDSCTVTTRDDVLLGRL